MTERKGPVLIEEEGVSASPPPDPAAAPPVPEFDAPAPAMARVARIGARRMSWLGRIFWSALVALLIAAMVDGIVTYAAGVIASGSLLGFTILGLIAVVLSALILLALRELFALARLQNIESVRERAGRARSEASLAGAKDVAAKLTRLYRSRPDLAWAASAVREREGDLLDADALLDVVERHYMAPLDEAAAEEVRIAARQVAGATALIPLALADVVVALTSNLRMIRRIAEVYGGRAGTLGSWRLFRSVAAHLIATGAVAVGDDLIGSVVGGGVVSRVSRRFGEGVVNGALTTRVGVAAMEVCRPMPFVARAKPSVTALMKSALTGFFQREEGG